MFHPGYPGAQAFPCGFKVVGESGNDGVGQAAGAYPRGREYQRAPVPDAVADATAELGAQSRVGPSVGEPGVDQLDDGAHRPGQVMPEESTAPRPASRWDPPAAPRPRH
jgi:hypothetical protein